MNDILIRGDTMRLIPYFLKKQGIETIGKNSNEESCIKTVKTFYYKDVDEDKDVYKQKLKRKLIMLENERLRSKGLSIVSEVGITISLIIGIIAISFSILGQAINTRNNVLNNQSSVEEKIETYENKIEEIDNRGKSEDELKEQYNEKINEIKEENNNNNINNSAKDDIDFYEEFLQNSYKVVEFLFAMIGVAILLKLINKIIFDNRNVAINIDKSVIEERLLDIEKKEKLKENKTLIKELKEIQKNINRNYI